METTGIKAKCILVIGPPGAGKTRFSKTLSKKLRIPHFELDLDLFDRRGEEKPKDEFNSRLEEILSLDSFIIDGLHYPSLAKRLKKAEAIYFFDFSKEECIKGIKEREGIDKPDSLNEETRLYLEVYESSRKKDVFALLDSHKDIPITVFRNRGEVDDYVKGLNH